MKLRSLLMLIAFSSINIINAQVFWTEDFDGAACATSGCDPSIVSWTIVSLGGEGATANTWYVSDTESGVAPPGCGAANLGDQSLHVGNVPGSTLAGFSCPNGDCGAAYDAGGPTEITNKRVESPTISCVGQSNITVDFNYIEAGDGALDDCSFWYFDGATWTNLDPMAKTPLGCSPQGQWTSIATINLPASADNNPLVKIGYLWVNNGDGAGSDPSVAIDDITLTSNPSGGPTANFSASDSTICVGDCISFTDLSTGGPIVGWGWQFTGADSLNSLVQNPSNICYSAPGTFDVALVVFDGSVFDTLIMPNFITVSPLPTVTANAAPSTTVCIGDPVTLTGGGATSYSWTGGVTDGVPFNAVATTSYTVTGTDGNGCSDTSSVTVTVNNCSVPIASFTTSATTICAGGTVTFTDNSTGINISAWNWTFPGGTPGTANTQGPHVVTFAAPGSYSVNLQITDSVGTDDTTIVITVNNCSVPTASFAASATTICAGGTVTFTDNSTGINISAWNWTFPGGAPGTANTQGPHVVTFAAPGSYSVNLQITDSVGTDDTTIVITVNNCSVPIASFTATSTTICEGDSITFTDNSTGTNISAWSWTFPGGTPGTANTQGPHTVVFPTAGSYNINLQITDSSGTDDTTIVVTVNSCTAATAAFTTSSTNICAGDSVVFTDASSAGITIWQWTFDSTGTGGVTPSTATGQGPHTIFYNNTGTYNAKLIVFDGTSFDTAWTVITVTDCSPTAAFAAAGSSNLCEGDSISFNDLSTGSPTSWTWSFPGGTPATATGSNPGFITYMTAGSYAVSLTISNQYGSDSITISGVITVNVCSAPTPGITMDDTDGEICVNNCIDFAYDAGTGGTPTSYAWSFPGGTPDTSNAMDPGLVCWNDTTGTFTVELTVSNAFGNSSTSQIIVVHEQPLVTAGPDVSVDIGMDGSLTATAVDTAGNVLTGGTYSWTPTDDLSCSDCQNPTVIQPLSSNMYTVTYTSAGGCTATDDVFLNVDMVFNIGVPSAFSPNGDGSNDLLLVRGKIVIKTMNFTIYNRYGQEVFSTTDVDVGWDGTHNGKELNPGVFVYYVNVTFIDGSAGKLKGNVTLVR